MRVKPFRTMAAAGMLLAAVAAPALGQAKPPAPAPVRPPTSQPSARPATAPAATAAPLPPGFKALAVPDNRFRLAHPADWVPAPPGELPEGAAAMLVSEQHPGASLSVIVETLPGPTAVKELAANTVELMKAETKGFELIENVETSVGGRAARRLVYNTVEEGERYQVLQVFTTYGITCYTIAFAGPLADFAKARPVAEQIIGTFRSASPGAAKPGELASFDGKAHGLALKYPAAWPKAEQTPAPTLVFMAFPGAAERTGDLLPASVSLIAVTVPGGGNLRDFAAGLADGARRTSPGLKLVENADTTLGGVPARRITLAGAIQGRDIKIQHLCTIRGNKGYSLFLTAEAKEFDKWQAEFTRVLGTVEWKN